MFKTFGRNPRGERLKRIESVANYRNGSFQNLHPTEVMLKNVSFIKLLKDFVNKPKTVNPTSLIPTIKTDLKNLPNDSTQLIWLGHSSYLINSYGFRILVDPVLFGPASPFAFFGKPFKGTSIYEPDDIPPIDLLIITHDHYDHLDYHTIRRIKNKTEHIITSLGVGEHLEYWGVDPKKITELNWGENKTINQSINITATPARHFSGRSTKRGKTLWSSFVIEVKGLKLFLGGDSGYDEEFKKIGERFGRAQYGDSWPYIHMKPEETAQAARDLNAGLLLPVHWGKFALSNHPWTEPITRLLKKARELNLNVTTPRIGESFVLGKTYPSNTWWNV
jgi:L-ascorbate metabolism protein UlaG (beta-lactamase superfamily)